MGAMSTLRVAALAVVGVRSRRSGSRRVERVAVVAVAVGRGKGLLATSLVVVAVAVAAMPRMLLDTPITLMAMPHRLVAPTTGTVLGAAGSTLAAACMMPAWLMAMAPGLGAVLGVVPMACMLQLLAASAVIALALEVLMGQGLALALLAAAVTMFQLLVSVTHLLCAPMLLVVVATAMVASAVQSLRCSSDGRHGLAVDLLRGRCCSLDRRLLSSPYLCAFLQQLRPVGVCENAAMLAASSLRMQQLPDHGLLWH